jgi:hypothetical protein
MMNVQFNLYAFPDSVLRIIATDLPPSPIRPGQVRTTTKIQYGDYVEQFMDGLILRQVYPHPPDGAVSLQEKVARF